MKENKIQLWLLLSLYKFIFNFIMYICCYNNYVLIMLNNKRIVALVMWSTLHKAQVNFFKCLKQWFLHLKWSKYVGNIFVYIVVFILCHYGYMLSLKLKIKQGSTLPLMLHLPNVVFPPLFYAHISHVLRTCPFTNRLYIIEEGVSIICHDQFFIWGRNSIKWQMFSNWQKFWFFLVF